MTQHDSPWDHPSTGTVTRADLVEAIKELGFSRRESAAHVDAVLTAMVDALSERKAVKLTNFGRFSVRDKGARPARNPRTGEAAEVSPRSVVVFRTSEGLRARLTEALSEETG